MSAIIIQKTMSLAVYQPSKSKQKIGGNQKLTLAEVIDTYAIIHIQFKYSL